MSASTTPPLGVLAMVRETLSLLLVHGRFLFPLAFVPALVLAVLATVAGVGGTVEPAAPVGAPALGALVLTTLADVLVGFVVTGVMALAAIDVLIGKRHSVGEYLSQTLRHIGPIVGLGVLLYVMAGIGLALLVVPGLYVLARFWPWIAAVVFEDAGWSGLTRAQELTEGYRWPIAGAIVLIVLAGVTLALVLTPVAALASAAGPVVLVPVEAAIAAIYYALVAVFTALLYARLREIKEGMSKGDIAALID